MHVLHVVRDLDATSGGISRSVPSLAFSQAQDCQGRLVSTLYQDRGNEKTLLAGFPRATDGIAPGVPTFVGVQASRKNPIGRFRRVLRDLHSRRRIDFMHIHGLWSPTLSAACRFARGNHIPYAIAPRGMLSGWAMGNKAMRKKVAWHLYQQSDLRHAAFIHVTSEQEATDAAKRVLNCKCVLIPNGCESGPLGELAGDDPWLRLQTLLTPESRWCVALGRIHPVKGLPDLLHAWKRILPNGWRLAIVGPDEAGHRAELESLIAALEIQNEVVFTGPIDSNRTRHFLSRADLLVQASHSENFGIAVAEALSVGTPVIATQGTPWESVVEHGCGWWVPNGVDGLSHGIASATSLSVEQLSRMGECGVQLIREQFSWEEMARRSLLAYDLVIANGDV